MRGLVVALTLAGSLGLAPLGFAMDDMSCADFSAMDPTGGWRPSRRWRATWPRAGG